jgi:tRNA(fMet)-specific endonuclease VapC
VTEPRFLLDSNICVYILADLQGPEAKRLAGQEEGAVATSAIVYAEVMRGLEGAMDEERDAGIELFTAVNVLPFDQRAADRYAALPFKRARLDRLIAAHALALGVTLVTNNERDFADVQGLAVENWTL